MGKSNSIEKQQKQNQAFQEYVDKINKDMDVRLAAMNKELEEMQERHYEKFPDKALLIEGKYSHMTTISEWSLNSISAIIDTCSKAIFGKSGSSPEGSEKKETSEEVSASIQAIKSREQYIANAAFDIVQSIVGGFKDTTSTSVEKKVDGKPIAPGMTMFISVENNAYSSAQFFSNEKIVQTIFAFKVYYSIKEGLSQSSLNDLQLYEDQKQTFRNQIETISKYIETLDPLDDEYDGKYQKLMNRAELMNRRMDDLTEKIKQLSADKITADRVFCNQLVEKMRAKRVPQNDAIYSADGTAFTYTGGSENAREKIRQWLPRGVWLSSLQTTDNVGHHYIATFQSNNRITRAMADGWIRQALGRETSFSFG